MITLMNCRVRSTIGQKDRRAGTVRDLPVPDEVVGPLPREIEPLLVEPVLERLWPRSTSRPRSSPPSAAAAGSEAPALPGCAQCLIRNVPSSLIRKNDTACALSMLLAERARMLMSGAENRSLPSSFFAGTSCIVDLAGQPGGDDEDGFLERAERRRLVRAGVADRARRRSTCRARRVACADRRSRTSADT
mgnify:CR=1 FL=1